MPGYYEDILPAEQPIEMRTILAIYLCSLTHPQSNTKIQILDVPDSLWYAVPC